MKQSAFFSLLNSHGVTEDKLLQISYKTGLIRRKRLITPNDLLYTICNESIHGGSSYNDLAMSYDRNAVISVSKQAMAKKIKFQCQEFMQEIVKILLEKRIKRENDTLVLNKLRYKRILIQDSTIIKLPLALYEIFSGVSNRHSKSTNARIQVVYDLISEQFICFSIDTYTKNDLSSAPALKILQGDLVLRDRGYLSFAEIKRHIDSDADCIYRYKSKTQLLDVETLEPIDLTALLKKNSYLDLEVRLNNKEKTIVRIISAPVDKKVAAERIRKAKIESRSKKPSKELLAQLHWSIFIVTISKEMADFSDIVKLYSLRWRIEIIFKSWKSNMNFSKYNNVSTIQLYVIVLARFIMAMLLNHFIYSKCKTIINQRFNKHLSLLKTINYLVKYPTATADLLLELSNKNIQNKGSVIMALKRYCCYDSRANRLNFEQEMIAILA